MHQLAVALHVLSVTAWVGGLFFLLVVVRPAIQPDEAPARTAFWARLLPRAFTIAWVSAAVALASGFGLLFSLYGGFAVAGMHIHLMAGFGILMTLMLAWSYARPLKRFELAEEHGETAAAEAALRRVLGWQWATLAAGAVTLVIGGVGAYIGLN